MNGVIFDMDGVLLDTHPAHMQAWRSLLKDAGRNVSDSDLEYVLDGHKRTEILSHFLGEMDESEAAHYGRIKDEYFSRFSDSIRPLPGLPELLNDLGRCGVPTAVATSAGRARSEALLTRFGLRSCFRSVVTGDDVCNGKPDPAIYRLAAVRLGILPQQLIVVEDAVSGVKAARAAGMRCVGIGGTSSAASLLSAGAQIVIPDFSAVTVDKLKQIFSSSQARN